MRPTDTTTSPYLFSVTAAGTSGGTEPTWPTALNATVTNGSVTFKNIGALTFGLGQLSVDLPVDLTPATNRRALRASRTTSCCGTRRGKRRSVT